MTISRNQVNKISNQFSAVYQFLTSKYYEVEDFTECIILSFLSRTNMIALGQPGIAKSAILREIVDLIDFDDIEGTPYFHIQMGSDVSPNNIFGAPDIHYFKENGIIKRHYKGFLPDAIVAFCSEFYRVNDQVANSGLLTILNEGEFKNGTDTIQTKLRFFMADTNFFPKQEDDLDVEDSDLKLQALHDRFLSRVYVKPLSDHNNKVKMVLMDDTQTTSIKISIHDIIKIQDALCDIVLKADIAEMMVHIASILEEKHHIFISPRRLKLSRNLVRAHAVLRGRITCVEDDLIALQFAFWQNIDDILIVKDTIFAVLDEPRKDAQKYHSFLDSIMDELDQNINNGRDLPDFDIHKLYTQALTDVMKLLEKIQTDYPRFDEIETIMNCFKQIENTYERLIIEQNALS